MEIKCQSYYVPWMLFWSIFAFFFIIWPFEPFTLLCGKFVVYAFLVCKMCTPKCQSCNFLWQISFRASIYSGFLHIQDIQLKTVNILRRTNLMILYSYNTISKDTVLQHQLTPTSLNIENIQQEETEYGYGLGFCCTTTLLSLNIKFQTLIQNS